MKVALDTNVLAYAAGVDDARRRDRAREIIGAISPSDLCLPQQVAGEFYNVLLRKGRKKRPQALEIVSDWVTLIGLSVSSPATFEQALELAAEHSFQIWDALIVTTAVAEGCGLLLSEDMQDGFRYRGLTLANPFEDDPHPAVASLLRS